MLAEDRELGPIWRTLLEERKFEQLYRAAFWLPDGDCWELYEKLKDIVPVRTWGDGVETYSDFIRPNEANDWPMYWAADTLLTVKKYCSNDYHIHNQTYNRPFLRPIKLAKATLLNDGIEYKGLKNTFVYFSKTGSLKQIDANLRDKIFTKGQNKLGYFIVREPYYTQPNFNDFDPDLETAAYHWRRKYPWRRSSSLDHVFRLDLIEPYTRIWHALNILWHYDQFRFTFQGFTGPERSKNIPRPYRADILLDIAQYSLKIGESVNALMKKEAEYDAVSYRNEKQARAKGSGKKSSIAKTNRLKSFMDEIEKLGDLFDRVPEASIIDIAFDNAVKSDPDLWKQGKGQKDEYLEQNIRSEEPYKSRYYAIFGKTA